MQQHHFLGSLIVAAAILAPVSTLAAAAPVRRASVTVQTRAYDRSHKDYHVWDDREDQAYRRYLGDNHRKYRRFSALNRKQQTAYWNWRHTSAGER